MGFLSVIQEELTADYLDANYYKEVLSTMFGNITVGQLFKTSAKQGLINCTLCDHISLKRELFIAHICNHLNLNPFKCNYCDKAYNRKCNLKSHVKRFHKASSILKVE